jgi:biotin synthase-like enzyme
MALNLPVYEQGPIRPPSEAASLLLRLTRNCPWNRCLFCPVYKGQTFSRRSLEEVKQDIEAIAEAAIIIKEISLKNGFGGEINRQTAALVQSQYPELFQIAFWLFKGGKTVFLQDGDSLLLPVSQLVEILGLLKEKFPSIQRITTYARSRTLLRRSVEELVLLKEAGLNRIHVGLESGNDAVLDFMEKGVTSLQHIEAGQRVKKSGISLSEYVILGLGGMELWREHALDTAKVLNQINPDFIRVRTLAVAPTSQLYKKQQQGEFKPLPDDDIIREEALFIENLNGIESYFYSDHILNLLEEISGKLPDDKLVMQKMINNYLSLPESEREIFRLGRRTGYYRFLNDLNNRSLRTPVETIYRQLQNKGVTVDDYIEQLKLRFV